ncbi:MAG: RNA pseudouridine synthase [Planctomycetes bacterium]|nr:RNA pseudouridine synthase [Planctomycetota bacterium]
MNSPAPKSKPLNYERLYADETHLVVSKPAGMGCLPDRRDMGRPNLLELLRLDYPTATLVHRIDIGTSGIVLVALSSEAMSFLSQQFEARTVHKEYLTYVSGFVPFEDLTVRRPVGPILYKDGGRVVRKGGPSETSFIRVRNYRGYARLLCHPLTGRTHQIRIHLSDMGLPIVGDLEYGGKFPLLSEFKRGYKSSRKQEGKEDAEKPLISRTCLHAHRIVYLPPGCTSMREQVCPEPADLEIFTNKLDKYAR